MNLGDSEHGIHKWTKAGVVAAILGPIVGVAVGVWAALLSHTDSKRVREGSAPIPTISIESSPAASTPPPIIVDVNIPPGGQWVSDAAVAWACSGDVVVNGQPLMDHDATTGLVILIPSGFPASLFAEGGASCLPATDDTLTEVADDLASEVLDHGCENNEGCETVDIRKLVGG